MTKFKPPHVSRKDVCAMSTQELWAILRSTNSMSEVFANQLCWTKAELRKRGFAVS